MMQENNLKNRYMLRFWSYTLKGIESLELLVASGKELNTSHIEQWECFLLLAKFSTPTKAIIATTSTWFSMFS